MAIAFRALASHSTNNETASPHDIVINKPTGTVTNDMMLAFIQCQGNVNAFDAVPSGWTQIVTQRTPTTSNAGVYMGAWWKRAGASESTSYTWSMAISSVFASAIISLSGASTSAAPVASASTYSDTATDTSVTAPAVTLPSTANWIVTAHGVNPSSASGVAITFTPSSTSMIERYDSAIVDDATTLRASLAIYTRAFLNAVNTGAHDATVSNDGRNVGITVALQPPVALPSGGAGWLRQFRGHQRRNNAVISRGWR